MFSSEKITSSVSIKKENVIFLLVKFTSIFMYVNISNDKYIFYFYFNCFLINFSYQKIFI